MDRPHVTRHPVRPGEPLVADRTLVALASVGVHVTLQGVEVNEVPVTVAAPELAARLWCLVMFLKQKHKKQLL
jgi:hypothetical protein